MYVETHRIFIVLVLTISNDIDDSGPYVQMTVLSK